MTDHNYSTANWNQPPHNRHSFQHMADLFSTASIYKGDGQASPLESQLTDLSQTPYPVGGGRTEPLQHFLDTTYTDAFLVLQHGVILTEEYRNNMQANTPHLLNSVSKSFVGMAAGIAVEDVSQQQLCAHAQDFNTRFSHAVRQGPQDQQGWSKSWCSTELAHVAAGDG